MKKRLMYLAAAGLGCAAPLAFVQAGAQDAAPSGPVFQDDATVIVPSFELPPSPFLSKEAREQQAMRKMMAEKMPVAMPADVAETRKRLDTMLAPQWELMRAMYPEIGRAHV